MIIKGCVNKVRKKQIKRKYLQCERIRSQNTYEELLQIKPRIKMVQAKKYEQIMEVEIKYRDAQLLVIRKI